MGRALRSRGEMYKKNVRKMRGMELKNKIGCDYLDEWNPWRECFPVSISTGGYLELQKL